MRSFKLAGPAILLFPVFALAQPAASTVAAQAPATQAQVAALQQAVQNAQSSADNAWMLTSAALVLLMTGPGLALFYGGLVRRKNILGTMMQSFAMMGLVTILWAIAGYSLAFGHGNLFIGGFEHFFLRGVGLTPNPDYSATIPEQTYMIYQLMFAIITPALITGAFAERMKFSAMAVFLSLWSLLVYSPMAHMVWGVGGLLNATGGHIPSLDFAGGTVVHITSGVSALITAIYLGKRLGYPHTNMPPHSMVLSFIGACLLWVGWFGFNAGSLSAPARSPPAPSSTPTSPPPPPPSAGPSPSGSTTASPPPSAPSPARSPAWSPSPRPPALFSPSLPCSSASSPASSAPSWSSRSKAASATTTPSMPLASTAQAEPSALCSPASSPPAPSTRPSAKACPTGAIDGHWGQLLNQAAGVGIAWGISIVGTLVLLFLVDKVIGLRVSPEQESEGLDLSQHGEEGYDLNS